MILERELQHFEAIRDELLKHHAGKFALIKDDQLVGTYDSFKDAFEAGVDELGNTSFLIKHIARDDHEGKAQYPSLTTGVMFAG